MDHPEAARETNRLARWLEGRGYSDVRVVSECCPQHIIARPPGGKKLVHYRFNPGGFVKLSVEFAWPNPTDWVPFEMAKEHFVGVEEAIGMEPSGDEGGAA